MAWGKRSKNKFNAEKVTYDNFTFHSKLEASVYTMLKSRVNSGEIEIIQNQDHIYLTKARILYIPDFKCQFVKTGEIFWVEAKGYEDPKWPMKKKLWKFYGPGILEIWRGTYQRPFLDEVITPQMGDDEAEDRTVNK